MGWHKRYTIAELKEMDNWQLMLSVIRERKSFCTNDYAPLYERLQKLESWVVKQQDLKGNS